MQPKVSIIVPVYNVEKYILRCMDSLVNQTLEDIEIIIINDGTKDNSVKLIEKNYNDSRIKIINKKNAGQAAARNDGLKESNGEYIFYVDSDDYIELETLENMYNLAIKNNSDLVICDYFKLYDNNKKVYQSTIPFYSSNNEKIPVLSMPGPVCKLFKKEILISNEINFLESHIFEDNAIIPYACSLCKNIIYTQVAYYYYYQRSGSSLNQKTYNKNLEDIFDALDYLYNKFKANNTLNKYFDELEYIYIEHLLHAANLRFIQYKEAYKNINIISNTLKEKFPNWRKNKYYKMQNIKYKIVCSLFYKKNILLLKLLLRKR
ncbi:MAG: glycosyltransferase family 2 protein [Bacilli bacterium]|nr:glycosyltransferase family 2 protein [Bacilli bacterium]